MHYYSHNIGDFDRTTRHLSRLERSIYRDLIDLYFDTEQALTLDVSALCRRIVARSEEEKSAVLGVLDEFFVETESGWTHEACDEQIASYRKKAVLARENGKTGGRPKKPTDNQTVTDKKPTETEIGSSQVMKSEPTGNPEQTHEKANQEPRTNNQKPVTNNPQTPASADADAEFVEAWSAYPKRPGASRADAFKAWSARRKEGVDPAAMVAGVKRYAAYVVASGTTPQYVKQPATFFGPGQHYAADWTYVPPSVPAQAGSVAGEKFRVAGLDHSSSRAAMEASMKRHGIVVPEGDEEINFA